MTHLYGQMLLISAVIYHLLQTPFLCTGKLFTDLTPLGCRCWCYPAHQHTDKKQTVYSFCYSQLTSSHLANRTILLSNRPIDSYTMYPFSTMKTRTGDLIVKVALFWSKRICTSVSFCLLGQNSNNVSHSNVQPVKTSLTLRTLLLRSSPLCLSNNHYSLIETFTVWISFSVLRFVMQDVILKYQCATVSLRASVCLPEFCLFDTHFSPLQRVSDKANRT